MSSESKFISSSKLLAILAAVILLLLGGIAFAVHRENNPNVKMCIQAPC